MGPRRIKPIPEYPASSNGIRLPLFSKYIFVRTDEQNRNRVFQAAGILNFLFWLKKPAVVPEQEINKLRSYLEDEAIDSEDISCFKSGDTIALKQGYFKGQKAEIKKINNQRVELILPVLGYRDRISDA